MWRSSILPCLSLRGRTLLINLLLDQDSRLDWTQSGYFAQSFSLREIAAGQASCAGGLQCHTHTTPGIRRPQETFELKSPQSALTRQNITHTILSLNVAVTGTLTRGIL